MRRLWSVAALALLTGGAAAACTVDQSTVTAYPDSVTAFDGGGEVMSAWYADPTERYRHFVLGRMDEPETLWVSAPGNAGLCGTSLTLGAEHVFEDTAPRLADLTGDGQAEVVTIRSHRDLGAQIAVYGWADGSLELIATTPYIGQPNRWLAVAAVADLDADGAIEIAYVDRPHLARILRVVRWQDGRLVEVATLQGVSNHRIGEPFISGGLRSCGEIREIVLASADWSGTVAVSLRDDALTQRPLDAFPTAEGLAAARVCP